MAHTDFTAPSVDNYAAARVLSNRFAQNIVQALIWRDGRGVTEEYAMTGEALEIRVIKQKGLSAGFRTIGADGVSNNAHFSTEDAEQPASQEYGIKLNQVYDRMVDIPTLMEDLIPLNVLNQTALQIENRVRFLINSFTFALIAGSALNHAAETGTSDRLIEWDSATEELFTKYMGAHEVLDRGDEDNYIDTFPIENRVGVFTTTGKYQLVNAEKRVFDVGSSRAAQLAEIGIAGDGGAETVNGSQLNTTVDGWFGDLNSTPLHMMSPRIVTYAEQILGLDPDALSGVVGAVNASQAVARVFAVPERQKIIDAQAGHGLRIQPLVRWGGTVFFPKGIVLLVEDGFVNPVVNWPGDELEVVGTESQ